MVQDSCSMNKQGVGMRGRAHRQKSGTTPDIPFSFIRTMTVGPGITPGLLTPARRGDRPGARGLHATPQGAA